MSPALAGGFLTTAPPGKAEDCTLNRVVRENFIEKVTFEQRSEAREEYYLEEDLSRTKSQNLQRHWGGSIFGLLEEWQRSLWVWSRVNKHESICDEVKDGGEL